MCSHTARAAHSLELGIKDAIKQVASFSRRATAKPSSSPLKWTNLTESGGAARIKVLKPYNVKGISWIAQHNMARNAVSKDW